MDFILFIAAAVVVFSFIGILYIASSKEERWYYYHKSSNTYYYTTKSMSNLSILGNKGIYFVLTLQDTDERIIVEKSSLLNSYKLMSK